MKAVALGVGLICWLNGLGAVAQESPAEAVQRQAEEERARRLTAKIEDLETSVLDLQKRLGRIEEDLGKLREELGRAAQSGRLAAVEERLSRLTSELAEVDKKRQTDNEKVVAYIERSLARLEKALSVPASKPPPLAGTGGAAAAKPGSAAGALAKPGAGEKLAEYVIQEGDTLSGLVARLRKEGVKVSQKQIMDANPNVNWNRLQINQKIYIPLPAP